jgi:hypothetical protein
MDYFVGTLGQIRVGKLIDFMEDYLSRGILSISC